MKKAGVALTTTRRKKFHKPTRTQARYVTATERYIPVLYIFVLHPLHRFPPAKAIPHHKDKESENKNEETGQNEGDGIFLPLSSNKTPNPPHLIAKTTNETLHYYFLLAYRIDLGIPCIHWANPLPLNTMR